MASDSRAALSINNLTKRYRIRRSVETAAGLPKHATFLALDDVSFDVQEGDLVGVIGKNGAGKSTLLKVLSRVTEPTSGSATIVGRVGSLLEVGTGFHPELTGRENVYMNGAVLGMRRADITRQFDTIVAFSGVEKFLDTPVKRYSSGMYVRLAFAVAAHLDPEILILDEVLSVGDAEFQRKCLEKVKQLASDGRTVLFVSHNMTAVQTLCNRAVWLENGKVKRTGPARDVTLEYMVRSRDELNNRTWPDPETAPGKGGIKVRSLRAYTVNTGVGRSALGIAPAALGVGRSALGIAPAALGVGRSAVENPAPTGTGEHSRAHAAQTKDRNSEVPSAAGGWAEIEGQSPPILQGGPGDRNQVPRREREGGALAKSDIRQAETTASAEREESDREGEGTTLTPNPLPKGEGAGGAPLANYPHPAPLPQGEGAITLEFEYWNQLQNAALNLSIVVYNGEGVNAFNSFPAPGSPMHGQEYKPGLYRTTCRIPPNFLNTGTHRVHVLFVLNQGHILYEDETALIFNVAETTETPEIFDLGSGAIRPLLRWETTRLA